MPVMTATVRVPSFDIKEIRRYAACPTGSDGIIAECMNELGELSYKVCYAEYDVKFDDGILDLGFAKTASKDLQRALKGCDRILLFAATVGILPDRLTEKYNRISPAKALFIQAAGAERTEALCDEFCRIKAEEYGNMGCDLLPRFSPGYGDLPLLLQKDIFSALDCTKNIGVTLNESLLMMPSKSVTAIAGVRKRKDTL